jgi:2-haloacid dehalogenase
VSGPQPVRDVVFDLGGVLIDWSPRYLFCGHLGRDPADVERFLAEICTAEWHRRLDAGEPFAAAGESLRRAFPEFGEWIESYVRGWPRMFAGAFGEAVDAFYALKSKGFRLHALSNYPGEQIAFLYRTFPFMRDFDTVILSGLIGAQKPDRAVFDYLLGRIGSRPCVFIDDRPENVAAARAAGLRAVRHVSANASGVLEALIAEAARA